MRFKKTQSHSEKIAPCERVLSENTTNIKECFSLSLPLSMGVNEPLCILAQSLVDLMTMGPVGQSMADRNQN